MQLYCVLWKLVTMTCEPSSLISAIHRNLPYFTNNPFQGANLTNATITVENILEDVLVATDHVLLSAFYILFH